MSECPRFERFLSEVIPDPVHRETVQMFAGLVLHPEAPCQRILHIHGLGPCGKSTFFVALDCALVAGGAQVVDVATLGKPYFSLERAEGLLLVLGEPRQLEAAQPRLKSIAAGQDQLYRVKGQSVIKTYVPRCRVMLQSQMPFDQGDDAWGHRLVCVEFARGFGEAEPGLLDKLLEEIAGVHAWAEEGFLKWRADHADN